MPLAQSAISDTSAIETELAELLREIEVITELSRKAIYENARNAQNQSDFKERNDGYLERHRKATERIAELEAEKRERIAKGITLDRFITDIEKRPRVFTEWDEALWLAVVDKATVATDRTMTFTFRNGSQITA